MVIKTIGSTATDHCQQANSVKTDFITCFCMQQVLPKCAVNRGKRVWLNYEHKQQGGKQQS